MKKHTDITGQRFGKLVALIHEPIKPFKNGTYWWFQCDCGVRKLIRIGHGTMSCGCLLRELNTTHGHLAYRQKSSEYRAWINMKTRCYNHNHKQYKDYGGRGIKVCSQWLASFERFFEDIGKKPSPKHSVDRIDNNGNYEPSNVRWATKLEQRANRRR